MKVGGPFLCARFDDSNRLVAGDDRAVKLFDLRTGNVVRALSGHTGKVTRVHVDDMRVVSGGLDERLLVWDLLTGTLQKTLLNAAPIKGFHCDKDKLAVGSITPRMSQHVLKLWNLRTGYALSTPTACVCMFVCSYVCSWALVCLCMYDYHRRIYYDLGSRVPMCAFVFV